MIGATEFPKKLVIRSARLAAMSIFIHLVFFAALVWRFVNSRNYAKTVSVSRFVGGEIWASYDSDDEVIRSKLRVTENESTFCSLPRDYDYWTDDDDIYDNYSCATLCPTGGVSRDCISPVEVAQHQQGQVLAVTSFIDEFLPRVSAAGIQPRTKISRFVMTADHLQYDIRFYYSVPVPHWRDSAKIVGMLEGSSSHGASDDKTYLKTVVLNAQGKVWKVIPPHMPKTFSMRELFDLAGIHPDGQNLYANRNVKPGISQPHPALRITGIVLSVVISCFEPANAADSYIRAKAADAQDFSYDACTLEVRQEPVAWAYRDSLTDTTEGQTLREYQGVRIQIVGEGVFEFVDLSVILLDVISILVVMAYPSKIMAFIVQRVFGNVSRVYRQALVEELNLEQHLAFATSSLVTASSSFSNLREVLPGGGFGIPYERFAENMKMMLGSHCPNELRLAKIIRFCFGFMVNADTWLRTTSPHCGMTPPCLSVQPHRDDDGLEAEAIGVEGFGHAFLHTNVMKIHNILSLFDQKTPPSFPERLVFPRELWTQIYKSSTSKDDGVLKHSVDGCTRTSNLAENSLRIEQLLQRVEASEAALVSSQSRVQKCEQLMHEMSQTLLRIDDSLKKHGLGMTMGTRCGESLLIRERDSFVHVPDDRTGISGVNACAAVRPLSGDLEGQVAIAEELVHASMKQVSFDSLCERVTKLERWVSIAEADVLDTRHSKQNSGACASTEVGADYAASTSKGAALKYSRPSGTRSDEGSAGRSGGRERDGRPRGPVEVMVCPEPGGRSALRAWMAASGGSVAL